MASKRKEKTQRAGSQEVTPEQLEGISEEDCDRIEAQIKALLAAQSRSPL